jgi:hypothetical protein
MTRQQYDQIVDAFELGIKLKDREGNWADYMEEEPKSLILDMSASVLVENVGGVVSEKAGSFLLATPPTPEELN